MELEKNPAFKNSRKSKYPPVVTETSEKDADKAFRRNKSLMTHCLEQVHGATEDQMNMIFSAVMNAYVNQTLFRFISVSIPAADLICTVKFHNEIPGYQNGHYFSEAESLFGYYNIPGMIPTFPGIVATDRAILFGHPESEHNECLYRTIKRAKPPKSKEYTHDSDTARF